MGDAPSPLAMARIHAAAFTQSRPWSQEEFTALLDSPLNFASGDGRCFALVRVIADEAELLTLATDPCFQRQGLARALMQDWQIQAQSRGAKTCFLEVAADNTAAIGLYLSQGFAPCGRRSGYYARRNAASVDAIVMRKELP
ncbi:GNAT family N-acetyltransferase [Pseudophaeobacter arcticus]|jgi:ribosomal-protein-alanine N-acetyltransferase|uniref:GNAT family N-acetyltransferase n=1 Tax=Pseudophaeobacter arcticus TaxID=385492 RepID=UPI0039E4AED7